MDGNLKCAHCGESIEDRKQSVADGDQSYCGRECAAQSSGRTPGTESQYTREVE